jgi:4-amino-4-deoxy-L-arabinose transferase-like glycosyltransferase
MGATSDLNIPFRDYFSSPKFSVMKIDKKKRSIFFAVVLLGLLYFGVFFFPNATGAQDQQMLSNLSHDEAVTYPYIVHMLTPGKDIHETWWRLIIYGDYHYGYPFYLLSMLVLIPVRILYGANFVDHTQLNLLILRQFISVLPIIISAGVLTYLQTRFRSWIKTLGLFIFLLTIQAVVRQNLIWWHPDALTVLFICLTLFFLDRDRLKFGKFFYLSAFTCGMAAAIKLSGFFFFLTIPAYLIAGVITQRVMIKNSCLAALGFLGIMTATIILSNPFLFYGSQREKLVQIQTEKTVELSEGYAHDDPTYYQKGPKWWEWTLTRWYAPPLFLLVLSGFLIAGCFWGSQKILNRLLVTWIFPYSIYLLFFLAPKPDHYWLPILLPLFSGMLIPFDIILNLPRFFPSRYRIEEIARLIALGLVTGIFIFQFMNNMNGNIPLYLSSFLK